MLRYRCINVPFPQIVQDITTFFSWDLNGYDTAQFVPPVKQAKAQAGDLASDPVTQISISVPDGACEGRSITVSLVYDYPVSMPFMGAVLGSDHIQLKAAVTDTILTPSCP